MITKKFMANGRAHLYLKIPEIKLGNKIDFFAIAVSKLNMFTFSKV